MIRPRYSIVGVLNKHLVISEINHVLVVVGGHVMSVHDEEQEYHRYECQDCPYRF